MKSAIVKRSIIINGHKTSVSLEDAFWSSLKNIAHTDGVPVSKMVTEIDRTRERGNLSSAIRLFILERVRTDGENGGPCPGYNTTLGSGALEPLAKSQESSNSPARQCQTAVTA